MSPPKPYKEQTPYEAQTDANTSQEWLSDQEPLDVDLDGLSDYASNMKTISDNLRDLSGQLQLLQTLPTQAWEGDVIGEAAYMRHRFIGDYAELQQYMANLQQALMNIGMAAQTIADAYRDTDGWSAADLNAVKWAFGDHTVPRPAGLPDGIEYKTFFELQHEQRQAQLGDEQSDRPAAVWSDQPPQTQDGVTTFVATNQYGETRTMTERYVPGVGRVITTVVTDRSGKEISRTEQTTWSAQVAGNVHQSTQTTKVNGEVTGKTVTTTVTNGSGGYSETTSNLDASGNVTGSTERTVDANGNQVIIRRDSDGNEIQRVHIGADTPGAEGSSSPALDAQQRYMSGQ